MDTVPSSAVNPLRASWEGSLFGAAFGDAWGYPVEFDSWDAIVRRFGVAGPQFPDDEEFVSDDTQMLLALAEALHHSAGGDIPSVQRAIRASYDSWLDDPDNNRSPGMTCLQALRAQRSLRLDEWARGSVVDSKGCGANMRVAAAAFLPSELLAPVAAWQAALTHGHPTALAASVATAAVILAAAKGVAQPGVLLTWGLEHAWAGETSPHPWAAEWLGPLTTSIGVDAGAYLREGYAELATALAQAQAGLRAQDPFDPCVYGGWGWTAEEALATALLCADRSDGPVDGLRRAVVTGGDSDSIACIAGAVLGAAHGPGAWPTRWRSALEPRYQRWIALAGTYHFGATTPVSSVAESGVQ